LIYVRTGTADYPQLKTTLKNMSFNLYIPEPIIWIVSTLVVLFILRLIANLIYPSN
jgi:hypothetical protein